MISNEHIALLTDGFTPILSGLNSLKVYTPIDLSLTNTTVLHLRYCSASEWEEFLLSELDRLGSNVFYGGYLEQRFLYDRSVNFQSNEPNKVRNIHLGIDLWCASGTGVCAPLKGKIHSYQDNKALGDYGPTILLEHEINQGIFYTLYGHLSSSSLIGIKTGDIINAGEEFCSIGNYPRNGDYAPHLHFQVIKDLGNMLGDYPGVCSSQDVDYYKRMCPDPMDLLKIIA